jgi:hypothetical protein
MRLPVLSLPWLLACACAPDAADSGDAGAATGLAAQPTTADPQSLVATSEVACGPVDQVEVAPGSDILVDWADLTVDMLGDPLPRIPFTDAIAVLVSYEGLTTEQVLEGCGLVDNVTIFNENTSSVGLHAPDEPTTRRYVLAEQMPAEGGVVMLDLAGGAIAARRFLLPVAGSTTTTVTW